MIRPKKFSVSPFLVRPSQKRTDNSRVASSFAPGDLSERRSTAGTRRTPRPRRRAESARVRPRENAGPLSPPPSRRSVRHDLGTVAAPDAEGRGQTGGDHSVALFKTPVDEGEEPRGRRHGLGIGKSPNHRGAEEADDQSRRRGEPRRGAGASQAMFRGKGRVEASHDPVLELLENGGLIRRRLRVAEPDPFAEAEPTRFPAWTARVSPARWISAANWRRSSASERSRSIQPAATAGIRVGFAMPAGEEIGESGVWRIGATGVGSVRVHRKRGARWRRRGRSCTCAGRRGRGNGPGKGRSG